MVVSQLLYADDTALVDQSAEEYARKRKFRVNVGKNKVMVMAREMVAASSKIRRTANSFTYLASWFNRDGGPKGEVKLRVGVGLETFGAMKRAMSIQVRV